MADITPPTIVITANKTALKAGDTALITFTLSEISTDFVLSDIVVTGGALSNFSGSGTTYSATFTASQNSTSQGLISVTSFKFSDAAGNANEDGSEANNRLTLTIDTISPTISLSTTNHFLDFNETATIIFSLSEPSTNFDISDVSVTGGTLSSFNGSGTTYSVVFTPNSVSNGKVSVGYARFSDLAGNFNTAFTETVTLIPYDPLKANVSWTRLIGTNGTERAPKLASGPDGSIYVTGSTTGALDGQINSGNTDTFLTKYNKEGTKLWTRLFGTTPTNSEHPTALVTDSDGAVYVGGFSVIQVNTNTTQGDKSFLTKYSADGTNAWTLMLDEVPYALTLGLDGSIYECHIVTGYVNGYKVDSIDGQKTFGDWDVAVTKYNSDGKKVWMRLQGSSSTDIPLSLTTSVDGSIYVSGDTFGSFDGQVNSGGRDVFVTKYKPDGTKLWTRLLGTSSDQNSSSIAIALDGSVYISGSTYGSLDGQVNDGNNYGFVAKYSADGTKLWTSLLDTGYRPNALLVNPDGTIFISGGCFESWDGNLKEGASTFLTKYNPDGTNVWTRVLAGLQDNVALTSGLDGSIFQSSSTLYSLDGQINSGNLDVYLLKLTLPDTSAPQIAISSSKYVLTAGESASILITLSKPSANFIQSDITTQGGSLSNFQGSGTNYSALFTASIEGANGASVSVGSGKFSDTLGIFNEDGADANNKVSFTLTIPADTTPPSIAVITTATSLSASQTATITFTLSESSSNFTVGDLTVVGGTLSNFSGSGTTYTALFSPTANSTANGTVSVASGVFTDTSGNPNTDGSDTNNTITLAVDTVVPTIALSSAKSSLIAGDTTTLTFTLSEASKTFTSSDVTVTGGGLSNFTGSGTTYTALFTPIANSTTNGIVSVSSGVFTDTAGNTNVDGADANNLLTLSVDTLAPTIAVSSNKLSLQGGDSATLNFTLSEASTNFAASDITVTGGTLSNFAGGGTTYTATFTLVSNSAVNGALSVPNGVFTDAAGNKNADGSDANNSVNFSRIPTITNEIHTLSVIVDKNVLGADAVLLKGLKESMTFTGGVKTKHIVEYSGLTFDYSQIDSLITTVTRDGEFTAEFAKEINDYLGSEQNITYSAAVAIVGAPSIDGIILSVAGADGNFVA